MTQYNHTTIHLGGYNSVVVPTTTKTYRPFGNGKDVSPTPEGDRPRDYPGDGLVSFWLSDDTAQALRDRLEPGETVEGALRRRHRCPPRPQTDRSVITPCNTGGNLLVITEDMHTELIMRSGPGETINTLIRRLIVLSDIHFTRKFRVPSVAERKWINQNRRAGNERGDQA